MDEMHWRRKAKVVILNRLHFHSLYFDAPRIGGFVQDAEHFVRNSFSVGEDFGKAASSEDIAQGCLQIALEKIQNV